MIQVVINILFFAVLIAMARSVYQYWQHAVTAEERMEKMQGEMAVMTKRQHKIMTALQSLGVPRWMVKTVQDKYYAKASKGVYANYLEATNIGQGPAREVSVRYVPFNGNDPVRISVTSPDRKRKEVYGIDASLWVRVSWRDASPLDGKVFLECSDVFENKHVQEIPIRTAVQMKQGCIVNV